jgi:hypothetical protein
MVQSNSARLSSASLVCDTDVVSFLKAKNTGNDYWQCQQGRQIKQSAYSRRLNLH